MQLTNEERLVALEAFSSLFKDKAPTYKAEVKNSMLEDEMSEVEVRIGKKKVATIYTHVEHILRCDVVMEDSIKNVCNKFYEEGLTLDDLLKEEGCEH